MADAQAGIGPFLGVFLQAQGWPPDAICGAVMTLGGVAGMLMTSPGRRARVHEPVGGGGVDVLVPR